MSFGLETALTLRIKAGTAVDRAVSAGLERNLRGLAAAVANHFIHLTLAAIAAVGLTTGCATCRATARLVLEALIGIELLFRSGENELRAALTANQRLVF